MMLIAIPMIIHKMDISPIFKILGISYITFRTIQAMVDSHNYGKLSFIEFTSFLLFPTTLLAEPIDRSYRFQEDLKKGYENLTFSNIGKGWDILIVGVLFKFVFAELVNKFWLYTIDENSVVLLDMINSAYSYTIYLFFDFAGYSAMAVGLSIMIGINVPMNFNHPYLAPNPQDFWRRFHITLGSWLTAYFFKPLYKYLHNFNILYLEDDENLLKHTKDILEDFVSNIYGVKNTIDAMKILLEKKVDVIISDILLENENGINFLKYIKNKDIQIPAILTTAHTDTNYLIESIKLKVENYLLKPINIDELLNSLYDVILPKIQEKEIKKNSNIIKTIGAITDSKQVEIIKYIFNNLDENNNFFGSYSEIMEQFSISKPTLIKLFKDLADKNILIKISHKTYQFDEKSLND